MAAPPPPVLILGESRRPLRDLYHALLVRSWWFTLAAIAAGTLALNVVFAVLFDQFDRPRGPGATAAIGPQHGQGLTCVDIDGGGQGMGGDGYQPPIAHGKGRAQEAEGWIAGRLIGPEGDDRRFDVGDGADQIGPGRTTPATPAGQQQPK